jgi:xanthine dehydrogenase YagS FAD-binding subunit
MRPFTYASPRSLDEAITLLTPALDQNGSAPRALAGGTDLLTLMKANLLEPEQLIDIKRLVDLDDDITEGPDGLTIGALATLAEVEDDPLVRALCPALGEAAALAATPQLRNMATIGGNLLQRPRCWYFRDPDIDCWLKSGDDCPAREGENQLHAIFDVSPCVAVHPSDPATALVALDAVVRLRGARGERELPVADFFSPPTEERRRETVIAGDELVVAIRIPPQGDGARSTYLKAMERKVWAFAMVSVAASIRMEGSRIAAALLVLGGVANVPWRSERAESILVGAAPSDEIIDRAAEAALADAQPLRASGYKVPLARALIRRALQTVTERDASVR